MSLPRKMTAEQTPSSADKRESTGPSDEKEESVRSNDVTEGVRTVNTPHSSMLGTIYDAAAASWDSARSMPHDNKGKNQTQVVMGSASSSAPSIQSTTPGVRPPDWMSTQRGWESSSRRQETMRSRGDDWINPPGMSNPPLPSPWGLAGVLHRCTAHLWSPGSGESQETLLVYLENLRRYGEEYPGVLLHIGPPGLMTMTEIFRFAKFMIALVKYTQAIEARRWARPIGEGFDSD
jgi:hypothetical protein